MFHSIWRSLWLLRVAFAALLLASCGGGGGDGGDGDPRFLQPGTPAIQGTWQLTLTENNLTSAAVTVDGSAVPSSAEVTQLAASAVARLIGTTTFQGYTVTQNGSTIRVTRGVDTDYTLQINSITTSNYQGCGTCQVGSNVSFTVVVNFTENGLLNSQNVPLNTATTTLVFRYTRVS